MNQEVSKMRARKARSREKKAKGARPAPLRHGPLVGFLIGLAIWAVAVALVAGRHPWELNTGPGILFTVAAESVFLLVITIATGLFVNMARPGTLRRNDSLLLIGAVALVALLPAKGILYASQGLGLVQPEIAGFLLPFAVAPMLLTILMSQTVAVAVGVWASMVMALMAHGDVSLFAAGITVSVVTAELLNGVRTRSKVLKHGLAIGVCEIAYVFATTALNWAQADAGLVLRQAGACLLSGLFAAILALLILPLLEYAFRITSDITLLEFADLGHPLLQRLAIEAPGTYHHSLVVANLGQAAADEIGANSLIVRICSYFHDIGKLTKPAFFTENIQGEPNPHDTLPPSMSALVISSHVKEGLGLAMLHKLPRPIRQAIREHHGTSLMTFFHHKAKASSKRTANKKPKTNGRSRFDSTENEFRYTGPRPSTRESGIICLADAVEAASRSLTKSSPTHLETLVGEIVNRKLEDGQLDDSRLTLNELARVKRSFVFTLTNMLHGRVPYPKDEDTDHQPSETPAHPAQDAQAADPIPDGEGAAAGPQPDVG